MTAWQKISKLYRKPDDAMLFGVCAGIAEHYGWRRRVVRVVTVILALMVTWPVILCYFLAALLLPTDDEAREMPNPTRGEEPPSRPVYSGGLRQRFERIEARTRRVEAYLHGHEYQLRSAFRDLEAGG